MRPVVIVLGVLVLAVVTVVVVVVVVFDGGDGGQPVQPNAADQKALSGQFINSPPKSYQRMP